MRLGHGRGWNRGTAELKSGRTTEPRDFGAAEVQDSVQSIGKGQRERSVSVGVDVPVRGLIRSLALCGAVILPI